MVVNLIRELINGWACCQICYNSYECWAQCPDCKKHICEKCEYMDKFPPDIEMCQVCPNCNTKFDIVRSDEMQKVDVDPKNFVKNADNSWNVVASKQVRDFFHLKEEEDNNA